jgi:hypothetical protein
MTRIFTLTDSITVVVIGLVFSLHSFAADSNATGLPTYPHGSGGKMDATYRSLPNGQHCIQYAADTTDALADVEAWYKKQLPDATVADINKNSLYGSFKLDGIKLLVGNNIVNVYRMANQKTTSIEIFKCKDAAQK